jgi:hypothetical protein
MTNLDFMTDAELGVYVLRAATAQGAKNSLDWFRLDHDSFASAAKRSRRRILRILQVSLLSEDLFDGWDKADFIEFFQFAELKSLTAFIKRYPVVWRAAHASGATEKIRRASHWQECYRALSVEEILRRVTELRPRKPLHLRQLDSRLYAGILGHRAREQIYQTLGWKFRKGGNRSPWAGMTALEISRSLDALRGTQSFRTKLSSARLYASREGFLLEFNVTLGLVSFSRLRIEAIRRVLVHNRLTSLAAVQAEWPELANFLRETGIGRPGFFQKVRELSSSMDEGNGGPSSVDDVNERGVRSLAPTLSSEGRYGGRHGVLSDNEQATV